MTSKPSSRPCSSLSLYWMAKGSPDGFASPCLSFRKTHTDPFIFWKTALITQTPPGVPSPSQTPCTETPLDCLSPTSRPRRARGWFWSEPSAFTPPTAVVGSCCPRPGLPFPVSSGSYTHFLRLSRHVTASRKTSLNAFWREGLSSLSSSQSSFNCWFCNSCMS